MRIRSDKGMQFFVTFLKVSFLPFLSLSLSLYIFFYVTNCMRHIPYVTPFTFVRLSHANILLEEPNWQHLSYLFVFVFFVALEKRIPSKNCILSCFGWSTSVLFNLLWVFLIFLRTAAVNTVSDILMQTFQLIWELWNYIVGWHNSVTAGFPRENTTEFPCGMLLFGTMK